MNKTLQFKDLFSCDLSMKEVDNNKNGRLALEMTGEMQLVVEL